MLGVAKRQALCLEFIESRGGLAKVGIESDDTDMSPAARASVTVGCADECHREVIGNTESERQFGNAATDDQHVGGRSSHDQFLARDGY
ncbi:hypothetical protein [Vreelandella malpeensis]|uniref:hypothetical protein n=1 Tax=Vreelandella malpeensis TaxID=1172368 RepID=UPI003084169C